MTKHLGEAIRDMNNPIEESTNADSMIVSNIMKEAAKNMRDAADMATDINGNKIQSRDLKEFNKINSDADNILKRVKKLLKKYP